MTSLRQRIVRFGGTALFLLATGAWASSRFQVGYDSQQIHSMKWTVFLIDQGQGGTTALRPNDLVAFETRNIPGFPDGVRFVKQVRAAAGDRVQVVMDRVLINALEVGRLDVTMVAQLGVDPRRFALDRTLALGEYFVMGTEPKSYDSRYYGVISSADVIGPAWGLW